jgi:large subunit ribosomal protein L9
MSANQVILLERIEKLGDMGEVVNVKPGYARNYLLPRKKALRATKANIAYFESQRKHLEAENEKRRKDAEAAAEKLKGLKVVMIRQAAESGQLYGSVNARDIAETISDLSGEKIERNMVELNQNIKSVGLFPVDVRLHPEVKVKTLVNVARTMDEAKIQEKTGRALIAEEGEVIDTQNIEEPEIEEPAVEELEEELKEVLEEDAYEAEKARLAEEAAAQAEIESQAEDAEKEPESAGPTKTDENEKAEK